MNLYAAIEAKYGFAIPEDYRRMERDGFFDLKNDATYLLIHEMEWLRPDEILAHKPADYHKPGFIPFAFTGGGDEWCWCPAMDPKAVVSCPRRQLRHVRRPRLRLDLCAVRRCPSSNDSTPRPSFAATTPPARFTRYFPAWIESLCRLRRLPSSSLTKGNSTGPADAPRSHVVARPRVSQAQRVRMDDTG